MIDNWNALDRIEHAERETPFCACGEPMVPAGRTDGIWLECASVREPDGSRLRRLMSVLTLPGHTRRLIVELYADAA
jgi:hypothetical protein